MIMRARAVLVALLFLSPALPLAAQELNLTAAVPVRSPTGTGVRNLTFGSITPLPGQTVDFDVVAATAPVSATVQAGEFRYAIQGSAGLQFIMTLPATLTSGALPPLTFAANGPEYGAYCAQTGGSCTLTNFNPAAGAVTACRSMNPGGNCRQNQTFPAGSELGVYIGGRISVPATARAAVYTGTITLTIVNVY